MKGGQAKCGSEADARGSDDDGRLLAPRESLLFPYYHVTQLRLLAVVRAEHYGVVCGLGLLEMAVEAGQPA
jgi:hypothetical protein